jgi:uncharacterized OsmC-like protein
MNNTAEKLSHMVNGVDTEILGNLATKISEDENYGKFKFRANNQWITGARSRSSIQGFYAGGKENTSRKEPLYVDADQPSFFYGQNTAPNPVEHLLHALNSCLVFTLVSHASVQGIQLDSVEASSEGDMDARGLFGISDQVNKGYSHIRVNMKVKSDADVDTLKTMAMYSPVYEVISRSVPVDFTLTKI